MTYIPSIRLADVLERAQIGLWVDTVQDGRIVLVCKLPETAIRAVFRGASCSVTVSIIQVGERPILCLGFRVQDEPDHPLTAIAPFTLSEDPARVIAMLAADRTALHFVNEFNHPALSAWCSFQPASAARVLDGIRATSAFVLTSESGTAANSVSILRSIETALDLFQAEMYRLSGTTAPEHVRVTEVVPLQLSLWEPQEIFEVSSTVSSGPLSIDDVDEGPKLEASLLAPIEALYPGHTYRSPMVREGSGGVRELTDLVAFDAQSICLVEAKALSVLTAPGDKASTRRASGVTKQIRKGLSQLAGALSNIRSEALICDMTGEPIAWPNRLDAPAHAIVVLSEMYAFVDWRWVAREVGQMSENDRYRALFHVIDSLELAHIARRSKDAEAFSGYLLQRWAAVKERGTAYGRTAFRSDMA